MSWYQLLEGVKERSNFDFKGSIINIETNENLTPSGDVVIEIPAEELSSVIEGVKEENIEKSVKVEGTNFKFGNSICDDDEAARIASWGVVIGEQAPGAFATLILKKKLLFLIRTYGENIKNSENAKAATLLNKISDNLIRFI